MNTRINKGQIGLIYRNGDFLKAVGEGRHFVNVFSERIEVYSADGQLKTQTNFNLIAQNESVIKLTDHVMVKENEICLVKKNGLFYSVLTTGRYLFINTVNKYEFTVFDINSTDEVKDVEIIGLANGLLKGYLKMVEVAEYQKAVLLVNGEYAETLSAGVKYFFQNQSKIELYKVDMRMKDLEVNGQEMLTKDKANLRMNFSLSYQVTDVLKATLRNTKYEVQLYTTAQLLLREVVGSLTLDELLAEKNAVSEYVMNGVLDTANDLGVRVTKAGVKDVILTGEMKEIMNRVLIAQKRAQANVITRREEVASTRNLLNTAKLLEENQMLYRLKEMEYLEKIAEKIGDITVGGNTDVLTQLKKIFGK